MDLRGRLQENRNEILFCYGKNSICITFHAGEMKYNFDSWVVWVNRPIKKCKQTRARYRNNHFGGNIAEIVEEDLRYINITLEKNIKFLSFG